jgi:hypothetical protein
MLVQLLECAVLEQVTSTTLIHHHHYHHHHHDRLQRFADASHFKFLLFRCALEAGATTEQARYSLKQNPKPVPIPHITTGAKARPRRLALSRICCRV